MTDETKQPIGTTGDGNDAPQTVDVVGAVGAATDATPESAEPVSVSVETVELAAVSPEPETVSAESVEVRRSMRKREPANDTVPVEPISVETVEIATTRSEPVAEAVPSEPVSERLTADSSEPVVTKQTQATRTRKERPVPAPAPVSTPPSGPYAVIETGGKQYRVRVGDAVSVERLAVDSGSDVTIDRVLLLGGNGATRIGTPVVTGASVTARIDDHVRGEKIVVFKYKPKKRYRRKMGHRQSLTKMTITAISG